MCVIIFMILDFWGFGSGGTFISRGGILMSIIYIYIYIMENFPEMLSQRILAGRILVQAWVINMLQFYIGPARFDCSRQPPVSRPVMVSISVGTMLYIYIYVYTYIHTYVHRYIHIYIYIERERQRYMMCMHIYIYNSYIGGDQA